MTIDLAVPLALVLQFLQRLLQDVFNMYETHNALPRGKCERRWAKPCEYLSQPRFLAANLGNLLVAYYATLFDFEGERFFSIPIARNTIEETKNIPEPKKSCSITL